MDEVFGASRRLTLTAALARLVPPGAGPGAVEAGAVDYVAERLGGIAQGGLDRLERLALEGWGRSFAALEPHRQDEILRAFAEEPSGAVALRQLVLLALEGSFCNPARGGNPQGAGWRFAGFGDTGERCRAS